MKQSALFCRRVLSVTVAIVTLVSTIAFGATSASAVPRCGDEVRIVASFDPTQGQNPENLAVAYDGTIYVTWLFAHSVVAIPPHGPEAIVTLPPGDLTGVAIDPIRPDLLAVGMFSQDPTISGIWTVPIGSFWGHGTPTRLVPLPTDALPNGLIFDPRGNLYVADSKRGLILEVARGTASATTWLSSVLLTATGATINGLTLPGVNGVKIDGNALYASNTSQALLVRVPMVHGAAGNPSIVKTGLSSVDDFAIHDGKVAAALNFANEVVTFTGAGPVTVVADEAHNDVENPSAVAFGHDDQLYIASAAYFGTHPALLVVDRDCHTRTRSTT